MTTNHPAHGPVSLDRLHQIRQYIERNNQYQNGGNRAYILADMLKVIDEVLASRNAEPVLPDEKPMPEASKMHAIDAVAAIAEVRGWNACRSAMLQAGNSPVTTDGYVLVPIEPTMEMLDEFDSIIYYGAEDSKDAWSRLIAAAPQQEAQ